MKPDPRVIASYNLLNAYLAARGQELKGVPAEGLAELLHERFSTCHDRGSIAALGALRTLDRLGQDQLIHAASAVNDRRTRWTEQSILPGPTSWQERMDQAAGRTVGNSPAGTARSLPEDEPGLKRLMRQPGPMPGGNSQVLALIDDLAGAYAHRGADLEVVARFAGVDPSMTFIPSASVRENVERMLAWAWVAEIPKSLVRALRHELVAAPKRRGLDDATRKALSDMTWTDPGVQNLVRRLAAGYANDVDALRDIFIRSNCNPAYVNWSGTPLSMAATVIAVASQVEHRLMPFVEKALAEMPVAKGA